MSTTLEAIAVPIIERRGVLFVAATRIPIDTVIYAYNDGAAAEEIVYRYPTLKLADVYTLIAYYLNNQEAVDSYLLRREAERVKLRVKIERQFPPHKLREQLLARQKKQRALAGE